MYMPISGSEVAIWPLVMIGFCVGVIGGYFGIGGAFMVTPALNIFGFPMAYAVGTDMAHVAGKSVVATFRHWRFGHVSIILALLMIIGTFPGIEVGAQLIMWLTKKGIEGSVVRWVYILILGFLAIYVFKEYFNARKQEKITGESVKDVVGTGLSSYIQKTLTVPPVIHCQMAGIKISAWAVIFIGCITGVVAGFLGVGGGFLRVPALLYVIGVPTKVAVGTDLFEVMISGAYGGFSYAAKGKVELVAAVIMLLGAAIGAQFGTLTTKYVHGLFIRLLFGITIASACISVTLRQIAWLFERQYSGVVSKALSVAGYKADQIRMMMVKTDVMYKWMVEHMQRPDYYSAFYKFWILREISQYLMLGSAVFLSAVILYFCFKGMADERRQNVSQRRPVQKTA
ncbi:MAG: sulfite exporter TauE/SafE family protein [Bacillota bacterium]